MSHVIEPASSGRAKCRGCGDKIGKGELRLGERLPNAYGDGEMTLWFHVACGAYCRPETMREALQGSELGERTRLLRACEAGVAHSRLTRIHGVQRSPSARARCRSCREPISKDLWRIQLQLFEEDRFNPAGYLHVNCAQNYFGTVDIMDRLVHFGGQVSDGEVAELRAELDRPAPPPRDDASSSTE